MARLLVQRGHTVRALCRPQSHIRELDVDRREGDLRDPESIRKAVDGCEFVFHVAADYRLWSRNPQALYDSNVQGTANVLAAAQRAGVGRIVYTSTVGCIGIPKNGIGDEQTPVAMREMSGHYKRSKWLAEQVALKQARAGLPVVIVNPTAPIGDHDCKPTPTGKIVVDFLRGKLNAFIDTGLNIVDAEEVAEGHLLAAERGKTGERYILGSENLTLQQVLHRLAAITGRPEPTRRIPYSLAFGAGLVTTAFANLTGVPPAVPMEAVRMARKKMFVTHAKATRELGFTPSPAETGLRKAVTWFQKNGYC